VKHKWIFLLLTVVLALSLVTAGCAEKQEKHAIFCWGQWSGDWLTIYVPKILLEDEFGYTTEIAELSTPAAWTAVAAGEADLFTDAWLPNQADLKEKYAATAISLGVIYGTEKDPCIQTWFVPKWVSEQYGITSVTDLNDPEIAKMFDVDGDGIGDLLGCDAAWRCAAFNDELIADHKLDTLYEQKYGSEMMMEAAIVGRMKKDEPVLFYLWTPHPFFIKYPIGESVVILEEASAPFGLATVIKIGNVDWIAENPKAAELVRQVEFTPADIGWAVGEINERGDDAATLEAIAREWMAEHQAEVDSWVKAAK